MKCGLCNGIIDLVINDYPFNTKALGQIQVPNIRRNVCRGCRDTNLVVSEAQKVNDFAAERIRKAIGKLPVSDFVAAGESAEYLSITKQALSKNKRIKRGFVYSTEMDGRQFYYRPSLEAFRDSGDGRIRLPNEVALINEKLAQVTATQEHLMAKLG